MNKPGGAWTTLVSKEVLTSLITWPQAPCVSLYLEHDLTNPSSEPDRIATKQLLRAARRQLADGFELRAGEIDEMLTAGEALLEDGQRPIGPPGLAIFSSTSRTCRLFLHQAHGQFARVTTRPVVGPLVAELTPAGHYFVLALSGNSVRLLRGNHDELTEVDVPGLPRSMADVAHEGGHERFTTMHAAAHAGGRVVAVRHAPAASDARKDQQRRYLRAINRAIEPVLRPAGGHLVLAGVAAELDVFRALSGYHRIAQTAVLGNPDGSTATELHHGTWPIAEPLLDGDRRAAVQAMKDDPANGSTDPATLMAVCREGGLATLLVRPDASQSLGFVPGFDPQDDPVSALIAAALAQRAGLYPLWDGELGEDIVVAGRFRY